jgi:hypothetical protein
MVVFTYSPIHSMNTEKVIKDISGQVRKTYYSWSNEPIGIKSSVNEPIGSNLFYKEIFKKTLINTKYNFCTKFSL